MNKNTFLLIFAFWTLAFGDGMAQKWNYDFIVPDDGNFMSAIYAANDRFDKEARFRI